MFVGIYSRLRVVVKFFHWMSSSCGGVVVLLFCLPLSAISLLKSPHRCVYVIGVCSDLVSDFSS